MKRAGREEKWKNRRNVHPHVNFSTSLKKKSWMKDLADDRAKGYRVSQLFRVAVGGWVRMGGVLTPSKDAVN